jgi:hypothetical protein
MKSIGDIVVDDIKSDVAYVKEKEKQAQIIELLMRGTKGTNVISDVLFSISVKLCFTSHTCNVTSSTIVFMLLINFSCN